MARKNGGEDYGYIKGVVEGIDEKIDRLFLTYDRHAQHDEDRFAGIEKRLDDTEQGMARVRGWAAGIGAATGAGATFLKDFLFPRQ